MAPEQKELLNLRTLPFRVNAAQTAMLIGCQLHDIPVLVRRGILKPLGNPRPNAVKYFATTAVLRLRDDERLLAKVTEALAQYWQTKNSAKTSQRGASSSRSFAPRLPGVQGDRDYCEQV